MLRLENASRTALAIHAICVNNGGIDRSALDDRPAWRQIAHRERDCRRKAIAARRVGIHDHVVGIDAIALQQHFANRRAPFGLFPPVQHGAEILARHRHRAGIQQPRAPQMQHHFRHAARHEDLHGGEVTRAVRQRVHKPRDFPVDPCPVFHRRPAQTGGMRDGRHVQNQIRGTAEGRVHDHGVGERRVAQHLAHRQAHLLQPQHGPRGPARHIEPDRLPGRRQRRMRERHAERFTHHLRRRRRAEELTAAARTGARAAQILRRVLQRNLVVRIPRAHRLHASRVFALFGQQRGAARNQDARELRRARQRHHHRGQTLIAGGHADHAVARRQRADLPPEHRRRIVPVRQTVEHPGRSLRASVARVGAVGRERHGAVRRKLLRRGLHQQPHFPVPRVIAERHRRAVFAPDTAVRGENQNLFAAQQLRVPAHPRVLRPPEQVAGRPVQQHFGGDGKRALRARSFGPDVENGGIRLRNLIEREIWHRRNDCIPRPPVSCI